MTTPTLTFAAETSQLKQATKDLDNVAKAGDKASKSQDNLSKSQKELQKQGRRTTNIMNNVGFQVQDFAVQLQGGQSFAVAFSQQGSQLVSAFSPMLGLFTALAGITGGVLYNAFTDATEASDLFETALKSLDKTVEETGDGTKILTEEFEKLVKFSRAAAISQLNSEIIKQNKALDSSRKSITDNLESLGDWNVAIGQSLDLSQLMTTRGFGRFGDQLSNISKAFKISTEDAEEFTGLIRGFFTKEIGVNEFRKQFDELFNTLDTKGQKGLLAFRDSLADISNKTITAEESIELMEGAVKDLDLALSKSSNSGIQYGEDLEKSLAKVFEIEEKRKQAAKKTADELLKLEEKFAAETAKQLERQVNQKNREDEILQSRVDSIERFGLSSLEREREILNRRKELINENVEDEKRRAEIIAALDDKFKESRLRSQARYYGQLSGLMSSENMKLFRIGQASAIAEATINGYQAASNAYANAPNPIVGAAMAALSAVQTGLLVASIASQKPPARAQGGQVRAGQSYVVGENGREVITMGNMGGNVTPNHKLSANDGAPIEVVTNIKIVGGDPNTTANTTISKTDRKYIIDVVVDQMSNPSSQGRAGLSRSSNVQNRGVR